MSLWGRLIYIRKQTILLADFNWWRNYGGDSPQIPTLARFEENGELRGMGYGAVESIIPIILSGLNISLVYFVLLPF